MKTRIPVLLAVTGLSLAAEEPFKTVGLADADYATVQAAIDAVPPGNREQKVILIRPGTYAGHTVLNKPRVTLRGSGPESRLIYHLGQASPGEDGQPVGWRGAAALWIPVEGEGAIIEDLTLENTFGKGMQAQACSAVADKLVFRRCHVLGWQDTLKIDSGRMLFLDCQIAGHVDFIYGSATAWFERCEIHCRDRGYITAPSTPPEKQGLVFMRCRVTFPEGNPAVFLGRPWHESPAATFIRCELGAGIRPEGWQPWNVKPPLVRFAEYACTGPGAATGKRVPWATASAGDPPAIFQRDQVLGDWKPDL